MSSICPARRLKTPPVNVAMLGARNSPPSSTTSVTPFIVSSDGASMVVPSRTVTDPPLWLTSDGAASDVVPASRSTVVLENHSALGKDAWQPVLRSSTVPERLSSSGRSSVGIET